MYNINGILFAKKFSVDRTMFPQKNAEVSPRSYMKCDENLTDSEH